MTLDFFTVRDAMLDSRESTTMKHKHEFCELFYITKGRMEIESEGKVYTLKENDAVLIPQNILHKSTVYGNSQRITISFICGKNKHKSAEACYDKFKFLTEGEILVFENFPAGESFHRFARYYYGDYEEKRHLILSCLYEIVVLAKEYATEGATADSAGLSDSILYRNYLIDSYLSAEYANGTLEELANLLHLSQRQTYRVVKSLYGKSFETCIMETKMAKAVQMMESGNLSFAQIGEQIGYKNPNSFFTAFKKYYGITPQQYKNGRTI
jgi:AraC-like DNA-binding protein